MTPSNRSTQFTKLHKVLKKHYKPVSVDAERPVLEHLVFACILEDAHYDLAEEAFATVVEEYFDWNEIRVSSVRELTETMARLPDPPAAASRMKRALQHVFEASYSFDLEALRKKNLGPAADALKKIDGATAFTASYVIQSALGGHSIPLDAGAMEVMRIMGLATDKEVGKRSISGLERAIPKSKGVEFGSLLHQLAADFTANPFAADVRAKFSEVDPESKNRWPKRQTGKRKAAPAEPEGKKPAKKKAAKKKAAAKETAKAPARKKKKVKKTVVAKKPTKKKKVAAKKTVKRKMASTKKTGRASTRKKKSAGGISKRKPR